MELLQDPSYLHRSLQQPQFKLRRETLFEKWPLSRLYINVIVYNSQTTTFWIVFIDCMHRIRTQACWTTSWNQQSGETIALGGNGMLCFGGEEVIAHLEPSLAQGRTRNESDSSNADQEEEDRCQQTVGHGRHSFQPTNQSLDIS